LSIDAARATKRVGNGSIVLVEFTDFQCPFCARHALETYPSLRRDLIDQDRLTYLAFAFPLERIHPYARKASEAAECAAKQGRYWEMHERIFANQRALKNPDFLAETAREIGLDEKLLEICLSNQASDAVAADIAEGERLDVNSTPTFFLGRRQPNGAIKLEKRIRGLVAFEHLSDAIEEVERSE
jgi:protein-disulfide isomerase